eukprot:6936697-Prymnesium_polylepis.1
MAGFSLSESSKDSKIDKAIGKMWPGGQHPMPEGFARPPLGLIVVYNVMPAAETLWEALKLVVPKEFMMRVRIFRRGKERQVLETLKEYIDMSQIPREFGGSSTVPFPYKNTACIQGKADGDERPSSQR